ncbi:mitochondrial intermediate peptidase, mitochondrial isoform X9 [Vigna angularis]|uniref:mitochondrial intermediate peptidase, mitochondrial isoform X9 n=1 Tax=Phaseolus angularis TaxID=3914 RepID=UPI0022B2F307|nr:mitochondrial intermediate peptidase, mitochondrial isoform X9 [Vigna angularis]
MNGAMWRVVSRGSSLIFHSKKRNALSVTARAFSAPTGLYGLPHLKTAKGFQSFVDEAIQRSGELISYICKKQPAGEVMRAMDEISDTVCSVVDSAELCRHTHPDREFVEEASKASMRINEYLHYLNTNHDLYDAIKKAEQECHMLSEEAKRGVRNLRADFERGGINLCSGKLDQVNTLNIEISQLCREYNENIVMDPGTVDIYPSSRIPRNLHYLVKPIHRSVSLITKDLSGSRGILKEKGFRITTDPQTVSSVLQFSSDDEVRKMVYIRGNSVPQANVDVLKRLISARHELAQIMGCSSYTEFSIKPNMALSPKVVMSFLLEMSKMVKPKTREEHRLLTKFKREKCGQSDGDLRPWDETYYMTMMKSSAYKLDASVVGSYFSLSNCIEGLKVLVQSLFGATFHSIPLAPNESWDPHVLKLSLHHPEEGDLGYLYLDLYSRKGKYPGCAHFAIKGGRRISQTEYQLPIVALVCNFPGSQNPSAVRLNHWEVETLFHEFGHALHSLLSRTDYQHFSGTRAVLDFAEIPSNLFEYYAWDYRVLRKFARHYSTGEQIPQKLVESMQGARDMFAATELQHLLCSC